MSELRNVHTTSIHIDTNIFLDETRDTLLKIEEVCKLQMAAMYSSSYDPRFHELLQNLAEFSTIAILNARPFGYSYASFQDEMTLQVTDLKRNKKGEVTEYKLKLK